MKNQDRVNHRWRNGVLLVAKILGGILATIVLISATIFSIAHLRPKSNTLYILNRTDNNITIRSIHVNGRWLGQGDRTLGAQGSGDPLGYQFRARGGSILTLIVKLGQGEETRLACKLEDENGVGCQYLAGIRDGPSIHCICDSHADFYD